MGKKKASIVLPILIENIAHQALQFGLTYVLSKYGAPITVITLIGLLA